jgi:hypothetical protein
VLGKLGSGLVMSGRVRFGMDPLNEGDHMARRGDTGIGCAWCVRLGHDSVLRSLVQVLAWSGGPWCGDLGIGAPRFDLAWEWR